MCASGSVVEYRLAKARVAGSNPVSRFPKPLIFQGFSLFLRECFPVVLHFHFFQRESMIDFIVIEWYTYSD